MCMLTKRRRSAQTAMNVESGQTIAIGGLNYARSGTGNSGLPWLRNVPVVNMFAAKQEGLDTQEQVIIYLTPRIWEPGMKVPVAKARGLNASSNPFSRFETGEKEKFGPSEGGTR